MKNRREFAKKYGNQTINHSEEEFVLEIAQKPLLSPGNRVNRRLCRNTVIPLWYYTYFREFRAGMAGLKVARRPSGLGSFIGSESRGRKNRGKRGMAEEVVTLPENCDWPVKSRVLYSLYSPRAFLFFFVRFFPWFLARRTIYARHR